MMSDTKSIVELAYAKALQLLTPEEILQLQQVAVETAFDYNQVRIAFVKMMNDKFEKSGLLIKDGEPLFLILNKLVLFPIQVVDPMAYWKYTPQEDEKEEKEWTKSLST